MSEHRRLTVVSKVPWTGPGTRSHLRKRFSARGRPCPPDEGWASLSNASQRRGAKVISFVYAVFVADLRQFDRLCRSRHGEGADQ
ncbi:hypothetical protein BN6_46350 [Saccharothrix espanaensis DSM 44229]|uniref:Uncharacterized protein n=1 Tax=Saccharothrix espanaensis (strain ATCC 51144 / DSM 44229 / JCM 9112 / NBRC 15066 / NRRL 15764) TaxID=1179773 RepID=K0JVM7_SACES|nr:hypothetical protein BN6_46350 [Saccharothrix espanaensis DSM 44229]